MADNKHKGTAIIIAMAVTHNVLSINGHSPNFPLSGNHSVENSNSERLSVSKIGIDLITNPNAIRNSSTMVNHVKPAITLLPILSFFILLLKLIRKEWQSGGEKSC